MVGGRRPPTTFEGRWKVFGGFGGEGGRESFWKVLGVAGRVAKPCRGPPRPRDFGSAVLKRVEAGHHPLTPLRSEGPFADVVASDVHHIVLTQGVSSSAPGVIRRPTPGGYLDTVIARIRARL